MPESIDFNVFWMPTDRARGRLIKSGMMCRALFLNPSPLKCLGDLVKEPLEHFDIPTDRIKVFLNGG